MTISNDTFTVSFPQDMTVEKFINDILMVVFFFTVGLEIKREVVCGELSNVKKALLPVIAAAGGMAVPALFYTFFNAGTSTVGGWGIPTATGCARQKAAGYTQKNSRRAGKPRAAAVCLFCPAAPKMRRTPKAAAHRRYST